MRLGNNSSSCWSNFQKYIFLYNNEFSIRCFFKCLLKVKVGHFNSMSILNNLFNNFNPIKRTVFIWTVEVLTVTCMFSKFDKVDIDMVMLYILKNLIAPNPICFTQKWMFFVKLIRLCEKYYSHQKKCQVLSVQMSMRSIKGNWSFSVQKFLVS